MYYINRRCFLEGKEWNIESFCMNIILNMCVLLWTEYTNLLSCKSHFIISEQGAGLNLVTNKGTGLTDWKGYIGYWGFHKYTSTCLRWRQKCGRRYKETWVWSSCGVWNSWPSLWHDQKENVAHKSYQVASFGEFVTSTCQCLIAFFFSFLLSCVKDHLIFFFSITGWVWWNVEQRV